MARQLQIFADTWQRAGLLGVLLLALCVAIGVGAVIWLGTSIAGAAVRSARRWQLRRELRVLRGGRSAPIFTVYPELEERGTRPPIRSLRRRPGDHDAA